MSFSRLTHTQKKAIRKMFARKRATADKLFKLRRRAISIMRDAKMSRRMIQPFDASAGVPKNTKHLTSKDNYFSSFQSRCAGSYKGPRILLDGAVSGEAQVQDKKKKHPKSYHRPRARPFPPLTTQQGRMKHTHVDIRTPHSLARPLALALAQVYARTTDRRTPKTSSIHIDSSLGA